MWQVEVDVRWWWLVGLSTSACRNWHEADQPDDTALFGCLPYALECPSCTLAEDLAQPDATRHWRCEDPSLGTLDGVARRATDAPADDEHYYDQDGRVAAHRIHDQEIPICEKSTLGVDEWWGAILDCAAVCEVDPSLPDADPTLPACG